MPNFLDTQDWWDPVSCTASCLAYRANPNWLGRDRIFGTTGNNERQSYCQKLGTDPLGGDLVFTDSVYKCDVFYDLSEAPATL